MKCFQINFKRRVCILTVLLTVMMVSCIDRYDNMPKYQKPDVLDGKLFDLISNQDSIQMELFAQMLMDTEFDSLINKTGTYAVFAPNDAAMRTFLQNKYGTSNLDDIPLASKDSLVRNHILQMPWNKEQLQSLSSKGWISPDDDANNEASAFKRQTLFKSDNKVYQVKREYVDGEPVEVILQHSNGEDRIVFNDANKFVPLFFDGFLSVADLNSEDYSFYFDRAYEANNVYYANAKVIGDEQFAENGFLYEIDDVVDVMPNAEEILQQGDYAQFLDLIYEYGEFSKNATATNNQEGADEGKEVPTLYNLNYTLPINIHNEIVGDLSSTVEDNMGILVPTDQAMEDFFQTYFSGGIYQSWETLPLNLRNIIVLNHIGQKALYKSDLEHGFFNALGDIVTYDISKINEKIYGSNCTFVGVNEVLVPLAFSKVSAPLLLDPSYSFFSAAMSNPEAKTLVQASTPSLLPLLKKEDAEYTLFMRDNSSFVRDSSLALFPIGDRDVLIYYDDDGLITQVREEYELERKLYGHIGIQPILDKGATREFIETVDGRHIMVDSIFDPVTGARLISGGGDASGIGHGNVAVDTFIVSTPYDSDKYGVTNGKNYTCDGWLSFTSENLRSILETKGVKFDALLKSVGLNNTDNPGKLDPKERYTLFLPSDAALEKAQVDTLSREELTKLLKFHIITGEFIFTDGREEMTRSYRTYSGDRINIETKVDTIKVLDENGDVYTTVPFSFDANIIAVKAPNIKSDAIKTNVVIQPIDTVIYPY